MLVSSWSKDVHSLPETYVFPPDQRAGDLIALACNNPIIDLNKVVDHHDRSETIQQILKAGREFGEVVGKYSVEVSKLVLRILDLICEGLGLEHGYFADELSQVQLLSVNQYPRCPDPSLAMGMHRHCDPNVVTILKQGNIDGLQVFKDGQWISVEPLPNAFVVIIGCQLQIISNGKLKNAKHRAVTNSNNARTTIVTFFNPCHDSIVEPAKALINGGSPLLYRAFQYKDFLANYTAKTGDTNTVLEPYKLQA
ncbi:Hyoscyamine 6-dioxygenase [Camellia lanceoleosa]|nr:Hyoscyamine 6-dioxygenase [Camellia lanceoleosa]